MRHKGNKRPKYKAGDVLESWIGGEGKHITSKWLVESVEYEPNEYFSSSYYILRNLEIGYTQHTQTSHIDMREPGYPLGTTGWRKIG